MGERYFVIAMVRMGKFEGFLGLLYEKTQKKVDMCTID
jgi:hypothetical protein